MGTKADSKRVRRYMRSRDNCHFITDVVMAADAVIGVPVPAPCHTAAMQTLVDAMEALRAHAAGLERSARIIKSREAIETDYDA